MNITGVIKVQKYSFASDDGVDLFLSVLLVVCRFFAAVTLKFRRLKNAQHTDGPTYGRTTGRTDPHIEMHGCFYTRLYT